jgi:hypothetical protein
MKAINRVREAQLRHARHYVSALKKADAFYMEGGLATDDGLSLFDLEQPILSGDRHGPKVI